jgi:hypothetical protein
LLGVIGSYYPLEILSELWRTFVEKSPKLASSVNNLDSLLQTLKKDFFYEVKLLNYLISISEENVTFFFSEKIGTVLEGNDNKNLVVALLVIMTECDSILFTRLFENFTTTNINIEEYSKFINICNVTNISYISTWVTHLLSNIAVKSTMNQFFPLLDLLEAVSKNNADAIKDLTLSKSQENYLSSLKPTPDTQTFLFDVLKNPYSLVSLLFEDIHFSVSVFKTSQKIDYSWVLELLAFVGCSSDVNTASSILFYLVTTRSIVPNVNSLFVQYFEFLNEKYLLHHPDCLQ